MKAEIVTVGSELLAGTAAFNSNFGEIALVLERAGVDVAFQTTVGDERSRIARVIAEAIRRTDLVVITGGLGPTHDDLTREGLSDAAGRPLFFDPSLEADLRAFFARRGRPMSEINLRQAYLPQGARAIPNPTGTAPGIELEVQGTTVFALPGVPVEMRAMLEGRVARWLEARSAGLAYFTRTLRVAGVGESDLAERIASVVDSCMVTGTPEVTLLAGGAEVTIVLRTRAGGAQEAASSIGPVEQKIRRILGTAIYGVDHESLEVVVSAALKARRQTLALAESFTGGALASRLVAVPGASMCLKLGLVTYAIDAKVGVLGVSPELIERYGAVSEQVAIAMAGRARALSGADLGLSTTGEAGPSSEQAPVGTMFIGLAWEQGVLARRFVAPGNREQIRRWGTTAALNTLRLRLLEG
ncbi:MAG: competence/damage-inducible protein A [Actinomycetota bacterium]